MTQTTAQVLLTAIFMAGAIVFVVLGSDQLAVALVGAIAGQGAAVVVAKTTNGNGDKR